MPKKTGLELSADLSKLLKELETANKNFKSLDQEAVKAATGIKKIEDASTKAGTKLRGFSKILSDLKGPLSGVFGRFTVAGVAANFITGAINRVQSFFSGLVRGSIEASSAFTELDSKARVVFGEGFGLVQKQVAAIAEEVGRARSAILQFSADIGAVLDASGISGKALGDMSTQIAKLAVDMASFVNSSDEEAFQALQSGLVGMVQPLRRYGVVLTQANLEQFAQEKGIKQSIRTMSQAQMVALRYAFIMDKTTTAQGDAARTADSFANQTRRLEGEWRTLNEELGKAATPMLADWLGGISSALQNTRLYVHALIGDIKSLREMIGNLPGVSFAKSTLGTANKWAKKIALPGFGTSSAIKQLFDGRIGERIASMKEQDGGSTEPTDPLELFHSLSGGAGSSGGGKTVEQREKEMARIEKEILQVLTKQAAERKKWQDSVRKGLMLKKEMGELSEEEEKGLKRMNHRIAYQEDVISEATDAWREQVDALEEVERKIGDINEKIADEKRELQDAIDGINEDSDKKRIRAIQDLMDEKENLDRRLKEGAGLSSEQSKRRKELTGILGGLSESERSLAQERNDEGLLEKVERERKEAIEAATAESEERMRGLKNELQQAERNRDEIEMLENEKSEKVKRALQDRNESTFESYKVLETKTKAFVDKMIGEYNRYISALNSAAEASNSAYGSATSKAFGGGLGYANGGEVFGPGGPRDDKIKAFLSRGEFVVNAAAAKMYRPMLDKINSFMAPRLASGGPVSNDNSRTASITVHNHGRAAEVYSDPTLQRWRANTMLR